MSSWPVCDYSRPGPEAVMATLALLGSAGPGKGTVRAVVMQNDLSSMRNAMIRVTFQCFSKNIKNSCNSVMAMRIY